MAKSNRGKTLKRIAKKAGRIFRGTCPLCERTGVKLLYPHKTEAYKLMQVCKNCRNK